MSRFTKFLQGLVTPTVTPKDSHTVPQGYSLTNSLIIAASIAEFTSGPESTFIDKATYVAMPYVIKAVAYESAQKNFVGESAN